MWDKVFPVLFIVVVLGTYLLGRSESLARDNAQREQLVAGCTRGGVRPALDAAAWIRAAAARRADGNQDAGDYYEGIADSLILTIASPEGYKGARAMIDVRQVEWEGKLIYVLTDQAKALQRQGCEEAYPAS